MAERPTPEALFKRLTGGVRGVKPTVFYGAPTGFAGILASPACLERKDVALKLVSSAGEALPAEIGERFKRHFGVDIVDGIGSTEMLHIFLSNRRTGALRHDWLAGAGYMIELRGEGGGARSGRRAGRSLRPGPSAALMYWGNRAKTRETFQGGWTKSGDKYIRNSDGSYTYAGRSDDGEGRRGLGEPVRGRSDVVQQPSVLEAAVDRRGRRRRPTKTKAFVVLKHGQSATDADLKHFVKDRLAPYKYPRAIEFIAELPKTARARSSASAYASGRRAEGEERHYNKIIEVLSAEPNSSFAKPDQRKEIQAKEPWISFVSFVRIADFSMGYSDFQIRNSLLALRLAAFASQGARFKRSGPR